MVDFHFKLHTQSSVQSQIYAGHILVARPIYKLLVNTGNLFLLICLFKIKIMGMVIIFIATIVSQVVVIVIVLITFFRFFPLSDVTLRNAERFM